MSIIQEPFGRRVEVPPPPYTPRLFGLLSVASTVDDPNPHILSGAVVAPGPVVGRARTLSDGCSPTPDDRTKDLSQTVTDGLWEPVTVYAGWQCSPVTSEVERASRALDALTRGEERALEFWLATGASDNAVPAAAPWPVITLLDDGGAGLARALGDLEALVADSYGGQGVLHVPSSRVALLTSMGLLEVRTGRLVSPTGLLVTANPYLPAPSGEVHVLASGPVQIRRGAVIQLDAFDRTVNTDTRLAERTSVIVTDWLAEPSADPGDD